MYENCTKFLCIFKQFPLFLYLDFLAIFSYEKFQKIINLKQNFQSLTNTTFYIFHTKINAVSMLQKSANLWKTYQ